MAATNPVGRKGLAILISNARLSYKPGDTITGIVFRQVPVLVGEKDVAVTIKFKGKAAVTVTQWSDHTGESQRTYPLAFELFDDLTTIQTLHQGPLEIHRKLEGIADDELGPGGYEEGVGRSWPFAVIVPMQTQEVSLSFGGNISQQPASETFRRLGLDVSEDGQGPPQCPPSSNYVGRREYAPYEFIHGSLDYCLEARLVSAHSQNSPVTRSPIPILSPNTSSKGS